MPDDINPKLWPFEAYIDHGDGSREYCQHARDNGDGSVTVYGFCPPFGFAERTYPRDHVRLAERPWEKAQRWYDLFESIYGNRK